MQKLFFVKHFFVLSFLLCSSFFYALYYGSVSQEVQKTKCPFSELTNSKYSSLYLKMFSGCKPNQNDEDKKIFALFYRTGTGHLLSISGLHIGGLSVVIYFFVSIIFFLWFKKNKKQFLPSFYVSMFFSLIISTSYVYLIGLEVPRLRALVTLLLLYSSFFLKFFRNRFLTYIVVLSTVLVILPGSVYSYSFYYSFLAVLALIIAHQKNYFNISCIIFVFILPLNLHSAGVINFGSVLVNFILVPIFVIFYFPFESFLFLLIKLGFEGATPFMDFFTYIFLGLLKVLDGLFSFLYISSSRTTTIETAGLYILLILFLYIYNIKNKLNKRRVDFIYGSFLLFALVSIFYIYFTYYDNKTTITIYDIKKTYNNNGSGDFIHIDLDGINIVVDTGHSEWSAMDVVKKLKTKKISKIDYLILTHSDSDHIGGIPYLLGVKELSIGKIFVSPCMFKKSSYYTPNLNVHKVCEDSFVNIDKKTKLQFIHPSCNIDNNVCDNNTALSFFLLTGGYNILFTSDVPATKIQKIQSFKETKNNKMYILQLPHHCSSKEKNTVIFDNLKPVLGFCTRSKDKLKSGLKPHKTPFPLLVTGQCGDIEIKVSEKAIKANSENCSKLSLQINKS